MNPANKYILAHLDHKTSGANFRVDYNITPEISIQYYGSPFASAGKYSAFKEITHPLAASYSDRFSLLNPVLAGNEYRIPPIGGHPSYSIQNTDFIFTHFRSNLVFLWEYRPGLQLFLVWGNERTGWRKESNSKVGNAIGQLNDAFPNNIFRSNLATGFRCKT